MSLSAGTGADVACLYLQVRVLKNDFLRYARSDEEDHVEAEESGWKLVHGDVFRSLYIFFVFIFFFSLFFLFFWNLFLESGLKLVHGDVFRSLFLSFSLSLSPLCLYPSSRARARSLSSFAPCRCSCSFFGLLWLSRCMRGVCELFSQACMRALCVWAWAWAWACAQVPQQQGAFLRYFGQRLAAGGRLCWGAGAGLSGSLLAGTLSLSKRTHSIVREHILQ